jgi:hypothetical protein
MSRPVFHLAFPVRDIKETVAYYRDRLGLAVDLIEEKRCIINFFGHQAVAHVSEKDIPERASLYPRHFGVILDSEQVFDAFCARLEKEKVTFFERLFTRFEGTPREHKTFFLKDPSNNLLEFKWYRDSRFVFLSHPDAPPLRRSSIFFSRSCAS